MKKPLNLVLFSLLLIGCATFQPQYKFSDESNKSISNKEIEHTFYLIGDVGSSVEGKNSKALESLKKEISKASESSTLLFLGDNVYPKGLPLKEDENYGSAKQELDKQIEVTKDFKGKSIFLAGNHDWYSGLDGLKNQEKVIKEALGEKSFLPEAGCGIDKIHVADDIELIVIDSHWFLTNWDKHPGINSDCHIRTRHDFFDEFESLIKKSKNKTTIVALHHPIFTNGAHGGEFSFIDHMKPLPVLGTLKNVVRKTSGVSNADIQNKHFLKLKSHLVTIAQESEKVVFVSGHEHNLQYLIQDNIHQIISGSGSKTKAVRNHGSGIFGYATSGYTKLMIYTDGSSEVVFYSADDEKVVFESEVFPPRVEKVNKVYPENFPASYEASIYSKEETEKSGFYKYFLGERYRRYYSEKVTVPTVTIDTLFGGLSPVRRGGGTQSKSLRLITKDGKKQYVMRAMRKQGTQYLQAAFYEDHYIGGQFDDTAAEQFILDVFTGSHPYAPFVIGDLSDAVGVYHLNPKLYYIPKHNALGDFNSEFGDELYMIEEHGSGGHGDLASFGNSNEVISTSEVIEKLHKGEDLVIDEESFIRARLFDMLIGDWDRHQDQWRWLEFEEDGKKVYRPLPRDRDQAFSIMSDGALLGTAVSLVPTSRVLRKYSDDLKDVKGVNAEPYALDKEFIQNSHKDVWDAQVKKIQEGLTDSVIEKAFLNIPKEVRGETIEEIKRKLKARRGNLQAISDRYYEVVNKYGIIKGTNKDDWFDIERLPEGKTKVTAYRIKKGKKAEIFHERTYARSETKEIWIYGLDDKDVFNVFGKGNAKIRVRIIGGQHKDVYDIQEGKKITFYDYKTKESVIKTNKGNKKLTDNYETNVYDYKKPKNSLFQTIPAIGLNPDDGFLLGLNLLYTTYGFERNPFTSQHSLNGGYYFATEGANITYNGEFANLIKNINFGIEVHYNSPDFSRNFFDFGNDTVNPNDIDDDAFDLDFNRVRIRTFYAKPSLIWNGNSGSKLRVGLLVESNEVERTEDRAIAQIFPNEDSDVFSDQTFYGADAHFTFENKDNKVFPTLGFKFDVEAGYKNNEDSGDGFGYIIPEIGFDYKLIPSGDLVLATDFKAHINIGDDFEFYQGATLGGNSGLRGFRNERFTGKQSYVQSTDVRWNFMDTKTNLVPISIGAYAGLDYGRVWLEDLEDSDKWHNSVGGGVFANIAERAAANISVFTGDEGIRFAFKLGFGF